jgi:hypothetical protein
LAQAAPNEQAERGPDRGQTSVADTDHPAGNLDFLGRTDPDPERNRGQQHPPSADRDPQHEAGGDEDQRQHRL